MIDIRKNIKCTYLRIFYAIIAVILYLQFSTVYENWKDSKIPENYLSHDYKVFTIGYDRDKIDKNHLELDDLVRFISKSTDSFMLQKNSDQGYTWIYYNNYEFGLDFEYGRGFSSEDYDGLRNVAIISSELRETVKEYNDELWITIDNMDFQVIGVFKYIENNINTNAKVYLNICSENYQIKGNYIDGKYCLDAGNNTNSILHKLNNWCGIILGKTFFQETSIDQIKVILNSQVIPSIIILFIIGIVVMGLICMTSIWITSRKQEIYVRKICGATNYKIIEMLLKEYFMIIIESNLIMGILTIKFFAQLEIILVTLFLSLMIGVINCIFILLQYNKMKLIELKVN